jgi:hypothetical protein
MLLTGVYLEGIMGGMHGGHYRLYLLFAGGGMVAMDEGSCGQG